MKNKALSLNHQHENSTFSLHSKTSRSPLLSFHTNELAARSPAQVLFSPQEMSLYLQRVKNTRQASHQQDSGGMVSDRVGFQSTMQRTCSQQFLPFVKERDGIGRLITDKESQNEELSTDAVQNQGRKEHTNKLLKSDAFNKLYQSTFQKMNQSQKKFIHDQNTDVKVNTTINTNSTNKANTDLEAQKPYKPIKESQINLTYLLQSYLPQKKCNTESNSSSLIKQQSSFQRQFVVKLDKIKEYKLSEGSMSFRDQQEPHSNQPNEPILSQTPSLRPLQLRKQNPSRQRNKSDLNPSGFVSLSSAPLNPLQLAYQRNLSSKMLTSRKDPTQQSHFQEHRLSYLEDVENSYKQAKIRMKNKSYSQQAQKTFFQNPRTEYSEEKEEELSSYFKPTEIIIKNQEKQESYPKVDRQISSQQQQKKTNMSTKQSQNQKNNSSTYDKTNYSKDQNDDQSLSGVFKGIKITQNHIDRIINNELAHFSILNQNEEAIANFSQDNITNFISDIGVLKIRARKLKKNIQLMSEKAMHNLRNIDQPN